MKTMKKAVAIVVLLWLVVLLAGAGQIVGASSTGGGGKAPSRDYADLKTYQGTWGVSVQVPNAGDPPEVSVFPVEPTPDQDFQRIGNYAVVIAWGQGAGGEPLVTVIPEKGQDALSQK